MNDIRKYFSTAVFHCFDLVLQYILKILTQLLWLSSISLKILLGNFPSFWGTKALRQHYYTSLLLKKVKSFYKINSASPQFGCTAVYPYTLKPAGKWGEQRNVLMSTPISQILVPGKNWSSNTNFSNVSTNAKSPHLPIHKLKFV